MTDRIFYEELRATIRDAIASYLDTYTDEELRELATESLNLPPRPTLADMTPKERDECQWFQADVETWGRAVIIAPNASDRRAMTLNQRGYVAYEDHESVTPRPDLPRMTWPGTGQDGEEATKVDYVSVAGGRTAYGPWTVARLRKKPAPAPALPDGWRLADHKDYGRVIVTNPTPDSNGYVAFVRRSDYLNSGHGNDWCKPAELTYIDTGQEADQ